MSQSSELFKFVTFRGAEKEFVVNLEEAPFPKIEVFSELTNKKFSFNKKVSGSLRDLIFSNRISPISLDDFKNTSLYKDSVNLSKIINGSSSENLDNTVKDFYKIRGNEKEIQQVILTLITLLIDESDKEFVEMIELSLRALMLCYNLLNKKISNNIFTISNFINQAVIKFPKEWYDFDIEKYDLSGNPLWRSKYDLLNDKVNELKVIDKKLEDVKLFRDEVNNISIEKPSLLIKPRPVRLTSSNKKKKSISISNTPVYKKEFKDQLKKRLKLQKKSVSNDLFTGFNSDETTPFMVATFLDEKESSLTVEKSEIMSALYSSGFTGQVSKLFEVMSNSFVTPAVRSLGFGDLYVVRENLKRYEAREISHIENVLPGESKKREHEVFNEVEVIEKSEVFNEQEERTDLQTSERFELNNASSDVVNDYFKVTAGVSVSASYGPADLKASTDITDISSKTKSVSNSITKAKEITSKATNIIKNSNKRSYSRRVLKRITESNTHSFEGNTEYVSGVYKWVDKIHNVELRHYGERLMIEVMIPEPGAYYMSQKSITSGTKKGNFDKTFDIVPTDIDVAGYMDLVHEYGAVDVPACPQRSMIAGFSWSSQPNESHDGSHQDNYSGYVKIPRGYYPHGVLVDCAAYGDVDDVDDDVQFYVSVNGEKVLESGIDFSNTKTELELKVMPDNNGVPVALRVVNHWDSTAIVNMSIYCRITRKLYSDWQLAVYQKLKEGYEREKALYEEEESDYVSYSLTDTLNNFSSSVHQERELEEVKKMSIMTLRNGKPFNFNGLSMNSSGISINSEEVASYSKIARFFEDGFEWEQCYYSLYPYYWGHNSTWDKSNTLQLSDTKHLTFLRSGMAKVIIPVTPGYEERVLHYIETKETKENTELSKVSWVPNSGDYVNSKNSELWSEILLNKRKELALGNTTIEVTTDSDIVKINGSRWTPDARDVEREIYIKGDLFTIKSIIDEKTFKLDRPYQLESSESEEFVIGSVRVGVPWEEKIPTNLVVLSENSSKLN